MTSRQMLDPACHRRFGTIGGLPGCTGVPDSAQDMSADPTEPLVAVVMPALNEAGKIGRVLDKMPHDGRFESIVVDDGSTDGTGDEAREHGAALVVRHDRRQGVGASIRDGWKAGIERGRPYLALLSGDDQHVPSDLIGAFDALLAQDADYLQGSRWMPGGRLIGGGNSSRARGTQLYSLAFSILVGRRVTDATNGFRIFKREVLDDAKIDLDQRWLDSYDLEPYVLYRAITRGYKVIEYPCTVVYHRAESYSKMKGIKDWWRLFRPALLLRTGVKQ
jgi:dolichol-phosphate mannosyltransferase